MKKFFVFALCVLGFILIAAPTAVEYRPVLLNGKPFGRAALINGVWAISVEDFAKAGGASLTLEPGFTLQGNTLNATISGYSTQNKKFEHKVGTADQSQIKMGQYKEQAAIKGEIKATVKGESKALFKVNKPGQISSHVLMEGGKGWLPLEDVAKAFGGTLTPVGNLKPGEAINLSFTSNPAAILIGL